MRKLRVVLCCIGMAGALSACAEMWDVDGLQTMKVKGTAFDVALRDGYVKLAAYEREQCDWRDTAAYVARGRLAAAGTPPAPEAIADRDLPGDKVGELTAARAKLMDVLTAANKAKAPQQTANAQLGYECWMEQQEENWQWDDIAACRKMYDDAMSYITAMNAVKPKPTPVAAPAPQAFTVYFTLNSHKLQGDALAVIKEAAAAFKTDKAGRADVAGYADRSGGTAYNDRLSSLRAEAVSTALVKLGVPESAISISAFGESDLAVPTADGVKEPRNRRVVIRILK